MKQLEIRKWDDVNRNYTFSKEEHKEALKVAIGIADEISMGHYQEGIRNDMAVDFAIAMMVLTGSDEIENTVDVLELSGTDRADMKNRLNTIESYLDSWSNLPFGYTIQNHYWIECYNLHDPNHTLKLIEVEQEED